MQDNRDPEPIRLVLVDAQALFRESLSRFLASQPHLEVVGECGTVAEALDILRATPADVVLLDLDLRAEQGEQAIPVARRGGYQGRFLMLAGAAGAKELADTIKLGASGIFMKSEGPERLVLAIRLVASGAVWIDPKAIQLMADQLAERPIGSAKPNILSEREEKVLAGILSGLTNRKIGDNMGLSEGTVKSIVQQLFLRAGVRTRSQLVRMALDGTLPAGRSFVLRQFNGVPDAERPSNPLPIGRSHG